MVSEYMYMAVILPHGYMEKGFNFRNLATYKTSDPYAPWFYFLRAPRAHLQSLLEVSRGWNRPKRMFKVFFYQTEILFKIYIGVYIFIPLMINLHCLYIDGGYETDKL